MSSFGAVLRAVSSGRLREQPGRLLVTVLAIALGVALATAVFLINAGALNEFGLAARKLVGQADLVLRGAAAGFDEGLFVQLLGDEAVVEASPALELDVAVLGGESTLRILAVDPLRAAQVQRDLLAGLGDLLALFERDSIALSATAARDLGLGPGDRLEVRSGTQAVALRVVDVLPDGAYPQRLADHGHRDRAVGLRSHRARQSHRPEAGAGRRRRRLPGKPRPGAARGDRRWRPGRRDPACRERDPGLPGQPQHARHGRAADRRVPGVLHAGAVSPPQARAAGPPASHRRDAAPGRAGVAGGGPPDRQCRVAGRRTARPGHCAGCFGPPRWRPRQRLRAGLRVCSAGRAVMAPRVLRDRECHCGGGSGGAGTRGGPTRAGARAEGRGCRTGGTAPASGLARTAARSRGCSVRCGAARGWHPRIRLPVGRGAVVRGGPAGAVRGRRRAGTAAATEGRGPGDGARAASWQRRAVRGESRRDHRELQPDGGDGHHGPFVPGVL